MKFKIMRRIAAMIIILGFAVNLNAQTATEAVDALKDGVAKAQAKDYLGAIESFKSCVSIYDALGETENENRATAIAQIPNMQYKHAFVFYKEKKYSESIEAFEKLAEYSEMYNDADNLKKAKGIIPQLYYFKGKDLLDAKNYEAALEALNQSIELNKNYPNAHLRKAQLFDEKGEVENFKLAIDGAIEASIAKKDTKSEENAKQMAGNFFLVAAADAVKTEKFSEAENYFNTLMIYKDADTDIYYQLAVIYNKQLKWDASIEAGNKALELFNEAGTTKDAKIYYELGNSYYGKNDTAAACDAYSKAAKGDYEASAKYQMEQVVKCQQ